MKQKSFLYSLYLLFHLISIYSYGATNLKSNDFKSIKNHKIGTLSIKSISSDTITKKSFAVAAFDKLTTNGSFTDILDPNKIKELPIGIKENKGNVEYAIVVTKAKFTPNYASLDVYARIVTPQAGADGGKKKLYFGAEGIKFSYNGKIIGDTKLAMLGDLTILFNQKNWGLTIEGGHLDESNGNTVNSNTYVKIDCKGIKELSLKGNVQISREVVIPLDVDGKPKLNKNDKVKTNFHVVGSDWNDILVNVSLPPFAIASQVKNKDKGFFSFLVNNAVLDLSDLRNHPTTVFPEDYESKGYLVAGTESWRGLYVESLEVGLPKEFKSKNQEEVISFEAHQLLIDNYGVSGTFSANNLITLKNGKTGGNNGWDYSLDQINVQITASEITEADLSGKIKLPIQSKKETTSTENTNESESTAEANSGEATTTNPPQTSKDYIAYSGLITDDAYLINATVVGNIDIDVWSAQATIAAGSSLDLRVKNKQFYPKATLNGSLKIQADASSDDNADKENTKKTVQFNGINFEGLTLQAEQPIIKVGAIGVEGEQKIAGFDASINDVFIQNIGSQVNLNIGVTVGLQENSFSASGAVKIKGSIHDFDGSKEWKYDGFELTQLGLKNVDIGVATVSGQFGLMNDHPVYGDGFNASLSVQDIAGLDNAGMSANAIFGSTDYKYWCFDASVKGLTIPIGGVVDISGFTGGAFYHMIPSTNPNTSNSTALSYIPNDEVGLALRAGVFGKVKKDELMSFMAAFNVSTNANGGLSTIGFLGEATILSDLSSIIPGGDLLTSAQNKLNDMAGNNSYINSLTQTSSSNSYTTNDVDEQYPTTQNQLSSIYAKLSMNYDFNNSSFLANLSTYVNTPGGFVKGTGTDGKAGEAILSITPDDWYLHVGTPEETIGLKVGFNSLSLESNSYFMTGTVIPDSPEPPAEVASILGLSAEDTSYMGAMNSLSSGSGLAFGSKLSFQTGDMTALFLYANFNAGLGLDLMLRDYGDASCSNSDGPIGIDGWYANGQAYAYLQGELGIKVNLFMIKKRIPIISSSTAALLQAKGPNPYWVRGYLGGKYDLLGGLVKGKYRFKIEFGEECELENGSALGGMKIIADLSPEKDSTEVDVFATPEATFVFPINKKITIPTDDGDQDYKIVLKKMTVINEQGDELSGTIEYDEDGSSAKFIANEVLPPNETLKALVEVSFKEKIGGQYKPIKVNGQLAVESKEHIFTTGTAPNYIPLHNIKYAYPVVDQQNYYKEESSNGYIKLKQGQDYLFEEGDWETATLFKSVDEDETMKSNFSYNPSTNKLTFETPELSNEKEYTFAIVAKNTKTNEQKAATKTLSLGDESVNNESDTSGATANVEIKQAQNSSKDEELERLSYTFKTSKYNTFADKVNAPDYSTLFTSISTGIITLSNHKSADEKFDKTELIGSDYTNKKALIKTTALMDDTYANVLNNLVYNEYPFNDDLKLDRDVPNTNAINKLSDTFALDSESNEEVTINIPPTNAVSILSNYLFYLNENENHSYLKTKFPFKYNLFQYYSNDFFELRNKAANLYSTPANRPEYINTLLESSPGAIHSINYKVKVEYIMPGNIKGTEAEVKYKNYQN